MGLFGAYIGKAPWINYHIEQLKNTLYLSHQQIATLLATTTEQLTAISTSETVLDLFETETTHGTVIDIKQSIQPFTRLWIINPDGILVATQGVFNPEIQNYLSTKEHYSPETEALLQTAMTNNVSYSSLWHRVDSGSHMIIALPIIKNEKIQGFIAADYPLTLLQKQSDDYNASNRSYELLLGYRFANKQILITNQTVNTDQESFFDQALNQALLGNANQGTYKDYRDTPSIAAWKHIARLNSGLVIKRDLSSIVRPFSILWYASILLIIIAIFFLCIEIFTQQTSFLMRLKQFCRYRYQAIIKKNVEYSLCVCSLILGLSILSIFIIFYHYHKQVFSRTQNFIINEQLKTHYITNKITLDMNALQQAARSIASTISQENYENLADYIPKKLSDSEQIYSIIVAFQPYKYQTTDRLYAPMWFKTEKGISSQQIENIYDYTVPNETTRYDTSWYATPLMENKEQWNSSTLSDFMEQKTISYAVPFYHKQDAAHKQPLGIVVVASLQDTLYREIRDIEHETQGKIVLIDNHGFFIYHADKVITHHGYPEKLFASEISDQEKWHLFANYLKNFKPNGRLVMEKLTSLDWLFSISFPATPTFLHQKSYLIDLLLLSLLFTILFIFMGLLGIRAYAGYREHDSITQKQFFAWYLLIMIGANISTWYIIYRDPIELDQQYAVVQDKEGLKRMLRLMPIAQKNNYIERPTGLSISQIDFLPDGSASVRARIWQIYNGTFAQGVTPPKTPSFTIKNSITSDIKYVAHEQDTPQTYRIIWHCNIQLSVLAQRWRYPLQRHHIILELEQVEQYGICIPIPDFEIFETIVQRNYPWIEEGSSYKQEYTITASFFSYQKQHNTKTSPQVIPTLNVHLIAKRNILNDILSCVTPMFFTFCTLFAALWLDAGYCITTSSSLAFTTIMLHNQVRNTNQTTQMTYLEYFLILLYITCLFDILLQILLLVRNKNNPVWSDHLLAQSKLFYWPVQVTLWFLITFILFLFKG